ncbi:MAG: hypothetical protein B7Y40_06920 [Gammaproteobacteria bacterium 28-57-27]|nr:MAG: hypothetical protein B7Y40_06920 [Gammaproteobacteria bacterium 28-57-27]
MAKLAISNIAWTGHNEQVFDLLAKLGVSGVEVAPGKVANGWDDLSVLKIRAYREQCANFGLSIPSFQAFLFGKPHFQLLGGEDVFEAMLEHVSFVAELAAEAGAGVLVYGAPKSRLLLGYGLAEAEALAIERLKKLAAVCASHGVSIGLEAVPSAYAGEFITSFTDSLRIVKAVNSPGLVLHLDTGCTWLNGDNVSLAIEQTSDLIRHFHISQPQLLDFSEPAPYHIEAAKALRERGYSHWCCIEMLESKSPLAAIEQAVNYVKSVYAISPD